MANNQIAASMVARYLKANHYEKTLVEFLKETNLGYECAVTRSGDWTLEKLVEEKTQFDTSLRFERRDHDEDRGWTTPYPSIPREPELPINTNVLCIAGGPDAIAISTANNLCNFVEPHPPFMHFAGQCWKADSPVLSTCFFADHFTASVTMSGKIMIHDFRTGTVIAERRDHGKWAVNVAKWQSPTEPSRVLIATAGWDQKIHVYEINTASLECPPAPDERCQLHAPQQTISLTSNPECVLFVTNPDTQRLYLVISRRDSSFVYYHRIDFIEAPLLSPPRTQQVLKPSIAVVPAGRQNIAPHSNAWVAFTPSALAVHPSDPTLVAIATSHLPHMKVIVIRLLFPDAANRPEVPTPTTAAAMARSDLALQDREDAAITLQVNAYAPQTPYSTPQIAWRPDGSGVWVNGDDGVVRGIELKTGKVVALLQAHEAGSKVRTLWAGTVDGGDGVRTEVLASGGFDRKAFIWEVENRGSQELP